MQNQLKLLFLVAAACCVVYLLIKLFVVVVVFTSLLVLLSSVWVCLLFGERATRLLAQIQLSLLDVEIKREELEDIRESRRLRRLVTFPAGHVAALHTPNQLDIQYIPERAQRVIEMAKPALLPPTTTSLDACQLLTNTPADEICLGVDFNGEVVSKTWKQLMSILILGLMGGGKSNTAAWILTQEIKRGSRIALIDKHARADESLHNRLHMFASAYDTPIADSPAAAQRVINHVRAVLGRRMKGEGVTYRLILVVDEFTAIMRQTKDSSGEWHNAAVALQNLIEDLNYEGRKYGVHVVCIGQASNASRTGGTEVRDLFHTRLIHGMRSRQAQLLGLAEEKHEIQRLETGQVCVDIEGRDDPFFIQVPEVTAEFMRSVAVHSRFKPNELPAPEHPTNQLVNSSERNRDEIQERVLALHSRGIGKAAIIQEVWGVKKGGSEKYKQAEREYSKIVCNQSGQTYQETVYNQRERACEGVSNGRTRTHPRKPTQRVLSTLAIQVDEVSLQKR